MKKMYDFAKRMGWTKAMWTLGRVCGLNDWQIMADVEASKARIALYG